MSKLNMYGHDIVVSKQTLIDKGVIQEAPKPKPKPTPKVRHLNSTWYDDALHRRNELNKRKHKGIRVY